MSDYFTYVIRSSSKDSETDNTNSCTIRLGNLPQQFQTFECQVVGFCISNIQQTFTTSIIELRTENLSIQNGGDSYLKSLRTIGFTNTDLHIESNIIFTVENWNNKSIRFNLYDENNALLTSNFNNTGVGPYNKPWTVILKVKGLN